MPDTSLRDPLRLGLIGAGAISNSYIQAVAPAMFADIVAIADTRPEAAQAAAEGAGCQAFSSHLEMAEKISIDAAIVCTPPSTHKDIVIDLLERGIPVLCEKPLSTDIASARAMIEASERTGVLMTMASKFRYVEDVIRARALIASGVLGDIIAIDNAFTSRVDMSQRWNALPELSGGGVVIDNGTHSVDIARYLIGPITDVFAAEGQRIQPIGVEDLATLFLKTQSRTMVTVDLSWSLDKSQEWFIQIFGTHGTAKIGWRESRFRQNGGGEWVSFGKGYDKLAAFQRNLKNFCSAVVGEEELLITQEDALASVEVIQAAYASLSRGQWISVRDRTVPLVRSVELASATASAN